MDSHIVIFDDSFYEKFLVPNKNAARELIKQFTRGEVHFMCTKCTYDKLEIKRLERDQIIPGWIGCYPCYDSEPVEELKCLLKLAARLHVRNNAILATGDAFLYEEFQKATDLPILHLENNELKYKGQHRVTSSQLEGKVNLKRLHEEVSSGIDGDEVFSEYWDKKRNKHTSEKNEVAATSAPVDGTAVDGTVFRKDDEKHKMLKVRRPKVVNHELIGHRDASLYLVHKVSDGDKHLNLAHVAKDWQNLISENYACLMMQTKGVNELLKVYMSRADGGLKVESSEVIQGFLRSEEHEVVSCLDEYLLVKAGNYLYVVDQIRNDTIPLPKTHSTCVNLENSVFCLLHDRRKGNDGKYKVVHVWSQTTRPKDRYGNLREAVGCETLVIQRGFEHYCSVDSYWNTVPVLSDLKRWRQYLKELVCVGSKFMFWDVRYENYLVKFNIMTLEFKKIRLPRHEYVANMEKRRFLFEDRGRLLMLYAGTSDAIIYILKEDLTWGFVKKVNHSENWERADDKTNTKSPFPVSSVLVKRYILFEKRENRQVWCYDLKDEVSKPLEGITFSNDYKGFAQAYSNSGRLLMGTSSNMRKQ